MKDSTGLNIFKYSLFYHNRMSHRKMMCVNVFPDHGEFVEIDLQREEMRADLKREGLLFTPYQIWGHFDMPVREKNIQKQKQIFAFGAERLRARGWVSYDPPPNGQIQIIQMFTEAVKRLPKKAPELIKPGTIFAQELIARFGDNISVGLTKIHCNGGDKFGYRIRDEVKHTVVLSRPKYDAWTAYAEALEVAGGPCT